MQSPNKGELYCEFEIDEDGNVVPTKIKTTTTEDYTEQIEL